MDDKTVHLLKLGIAIGAMREGAVHASVRKSLAIGVPKEEIEQVVALAAGALDLPATVAIYSWVHDVSYRENVMRILIVDDEEIQRVSLLDDLQDAQYEATAVASPRAALELLGEELFDVVLTDLKMPGMDGITLLERIKEIQPEATVIMMTAYGTFESAQQALELGAYSYLTKPFSADKLLMLLKQVRSDKTPRE